MIWTNLTYNCLVEKRKRTEETPQTGAANGPRADSNGGPAVSSLQHYYFFQILLPFFGLDVPKDCLPFVHAYAEHHRCETLKQCDCICDDPKILCS